MKCISVQQMPNGFEVETPTFGYWFKAGAAFTLGAGMISIIASAIGFVLFFLVAGSFAALLRHF